MAELIKRTDNLNQGREKLNESIKDANKAKEDAIKALARSLSAEQIAQLAELKSDDTQQQLDNIIIESGTSDAETIQARGNYPILNDRLNSVDQNLAQSSLFVSENRSTTKKVLPRQPLVVFVDDDGHRKVYDTLYPIFKEKGITAGCSIITGWIDSRPQSIMSRNQIRELISEGWEMMGHTHDLSTPNMLGHTYEEVVADITENRRQLDLLGSKSRGFTYPQNAHDATVRRAVQNHFDFAFGGTGINRGTLNPMEINRIGFGPWGHGDDLAAYESHVDDIDANGGLLVFMLHIGETSPEEIAILPSLIDYIHSKGIPIVNPSEAYDMYGPKLFVGDQRDKYFSLGSDVVRSNFDIKLDGLFMPIFLPVNAKGASAHITEFEIGETIIQITSAFASSDGSFPVNAAGAFHTFRYTASEHAYNRQEYRVYNSNDVYTRRALANGGWGTWVKEVNSTEIDEYRMNSATNEDPPNSYPLRKRTVEYIGASRMANLNFPTKEAAMLITDVSISHDFVKQELVDRWNNEIYHRTGYGTTWRPWKKITSVTV